MKWVVAFLLVLTGPLGPDSSRATEIQGKWGVGVAVGSLFSSGAEASIIRGTSARTAWIGDITVNVSSSHGNSKLAYHTPYEDTTFVGPARTDRATIEVGPRLRRFASPGSSFSPYGDVYVHFTDVFNHTSQPNFANSATQIGGRVGIAIGAEYFSTRWPFSIAAHTDILTFAVAHSTSKSNENGRVFAASSTDLSGAATLHPVVQVRVYW